MNVCGILIAPLLDARRDERADGTLAAGVDVVSRPTDCRRVRGLTATTTSARPISTDDTRRDRLLAASDQHHRPSVDAI
jgi:hypothetical protein